MAKLYQKRVSNLTSVLAGLLALALPALLSAAPLPNFTAHYQLRYGNTVVGTRVLTFTREGQHYTFNSIITSSGIAALLSPNPIRETSRGVITNDQLLSAQYMRSNGNKPSRNMRLFIDHDRQQVQSKLPEPVSYAFKPVLRDKLNEILGFMAANDGDVLGHYSIAQNSRPKYYQLEKLGAEKLTTSAGEYEALRYKRSRGSREDRYTYIWIVPALHNLPVKIENHKGNTVKSMTLTKVVGL